MNPERLEYLVQKVHTLPDPEARDAALELVQAIMELHAAGLGRMMEIVSSSPAGDSVLDQFGGDSAAGAILLLHDLHPLDLETRVRRALENASLRVRGAHVEIVSIREAAVHVRIEGGPAFEAAVRQALIEAAPDAGEIVVEFVGASSNQFVPLATLLPG